VWEKLARQGCGSRTWAGVAGGILARCGSPGGCEGNDDEAGVDCAKAADGGWGWEPRVEPVGVQTKQRDASGEGLTLCQ
jgi:hypothetical protein